jgi:hypothetical protein
MLPVVGTLRPTANNRRNPIGFWSIIIYQRDPTQSGAPWITQSERPEHRVLEREHRRDRRRPLDRRNHRQTLPVGPAGRGLQDLSTPNVPIQDTGAPGGWLLGHASDGETLSDRWG